jgi:hypothetical protein
MPKKIPWPDLTHDQHIQILSEQTIDQIIAEYELPGSNTDAFRAYLTSRLSLWTPGNLAGDKRTSDASPTKEPLMAASRDLDRSEALLELIDNSIDAWMLRRQKQPAKTAKELIIRIIIDEDKYQLTYEDNSGGLTEQKLPHLVIPGLSDTTETMATIGSYKTGGKKAVFRLAKEANILTRYWNPSETGDEAWSVHLDEQWMNDATAFNFSYWPLEDETVLNRGQTRYVFQLREEPVGGTPWFLERDHIKTITDAIQRTYSLLLIRHPNIKIFFKNLQEPVKPVTDLYDFSGTNRDGTNIQPQQVTFSFKLPDPDGALQKVEAEIILGCRRTSGSGEGKANWGIDLYGNDRLFVDFDQETFSSLIPIRGGAKNLIRGIINLRGPNVFIPWDTHKRHLNPDREIMRVLTKHPTIREFFDRWYDVYQALSKSDEVKQLIKDALPHQIDPEKNDLYIPFRQSVSIDPGRKQKAPLPKSIPVPSVNLKKKTADSIQVKFTLTLDEARAICSHFGISGRVEAENVVEQIADEIKTAILQIARKQKGGR